MKSLLTGLAMFAAVAMSASVASAASLGIVGGSNFNLTSGFDLGATTGLSAGDTVKRFTRNNSAGGAILTDAPATLQFEYLGSDASNTNSFVIENPHTTVFTQASALYSTYEMTETSNGLLGFEFETEYKTCILFVICFNVEKEAENDGSIDRHLSIALFQDVDGSLIALFGDGSGDSDMDDMAVRISVVPLPAALPLYGAGLAVMGFIGWRKRQKATAQA
jgi:hypothetical protein